MSRKLVYMGEERCDFIYYLSLIASKTANKVVVVDDSITKDLFDSVSKGECENVFEWYNILFVKDVDVWNSEETKDADYVLVYAGKNKDHEMKNYVPREDEELEDRSVIYLLMPNYTKKSIEDVSNITVGDTDKVICIPRDFCSKKITDKSLSFLMGISEDDIVGNIPLNTEDMAAYVALTHNGHQSIKGASDVTREALKYLVCTLLDMDEKKAKKLIASTKKMKRK